MVEAGPEGRTWVGWTKVPSQIMAWLVLQQHFLENDLWPNSAEAEGLELPSPGGADVSVRAEI